jgi:hypothetical protein
MKSFTTGKGILNQLRTRRRHRRYFHGPLAARPGRPYHALEGADDTAGSHRDGVRILAEQLDMDLDQFLGSLDLFAHGSTITTNTVTERDGPQSAYAS